MGPNRKLIINTTLTLSSTWPEADILEIKVFQGPFPEDEIGCTLVPVGCLLVKPHSPSTRYSFPCFLSDVSNVFSSIVQPMDWHIVSKINAIVHNEPTEQGRAKLLSMSALTQSSPIIPTCDLDRDDLAAALVEARKSEAATSVSGTLGVVVQGMLSKRDRRDAGSRKISKADSYSIEMNMMPDATKTSGLGANPVRLGGGGAFDGSVEWGLTAELPLAFSVQQVRRCLLILSVFVLWVFGLTIKHQCQNLLQCKTN